jgi:hypothetical protein
LTTASHRPIAISSCSARASRRAKTDISTPGELWTQEEWDRCGADDSEQVDESFVIAKLELLRNVEAEARQLGVDRRDAYTVVIASVLSFGPELIEYLQAADDNERQLFFSRMEVDEDDDG